MPTLKPRAASSPTEPVLRFFLLCCWVVLVGLACAAPKQSDGEAGTSELWGVEGEKWSPQGRLPDFSYAGYHQGESPIPELPMAVSVSAYGAIGDGVADDTEAFHAALAAIDEGAIFVPRGRYRLTKVLRMRKSGVVLRGAGRGKTVLFFPEPLYTAEGVGPQQSPYGPYGWSWGGGFIWAEGPPETDSLLTKVTGRSQRGDESVEVESTAGIEVGDYVRLVQHESEGSLTLHLHAGQPLGGRCKIDRPDFKIVDWAVKVTRVEPQRIHFGRPLRVDVRPEWRAEIRSYEPTLSEVGVEGMTIEFPETVYNGHHKEPGYNAILFQSVFNGWVRDVEVLNFDAGVHFWYSRYTTLDGIVLAGRSGHYGLNLGGCQDCLMTRFTLENSSVHDLSTSNLGNGSVFSRGTGPNINFDHHRGAPYENLFSDIDVGRAWTGGRRVWDSSGTQSGHNAAARETFWHLRPKLIDKKFPQWPAVNIIGNIRPAAKVPATTIDGWVEDVRNLEPKELHRAQLARRLGRELPKPVPLPKRRPSEE